MTLEEYDRALRLRGILDGLGYLFLASYAGGPSRGELLRKDTKRGIVDVGNPVFSTVEAAIAFAQGFEAGRRAK